MQVLHKKWLPTKNGNLNLTHCVKFLIWPPNTRMIRFPGASKDVRLYPINNIPSTGYRSKHGTGYIIKTDTMLFMPYFESLVYRSKGVSCGIIVVNYSPPKYEYHQTNILLKINLNNYPGHLSMPLLGTRIETSLFNSNISIPGVRFMCCNIKNISRQTHVKIQLPIDIK